MEAAQGSKMKTENESWYIARKTLENLSMTGHVPWYKLWSAMWHASWYATTHIARYAVWDAAYKTLDAGCAWADAIGYAIWDICSMYTCGKGDQENGST